AFSWLDQTSARVKVPRWIMACAAGMLALIAAAAAVAAVPWPLSPSPGIRVAATPASPSREEATQASQLHEYRERGPESPRCRSVLWLSIWILVPTYAFYHTSVPFAATIAEWRQSLEESLATRHAYIWP